MQKTLDYRTSIERTTALDAIVFPLVSQYSSYFRLLIEVFIRKNFGRRYYRFSSALTVFILLIAFPFVLNFISWMFTPPQSRPGYIEGYGHYTSGDKDILAGYQAWLIFSVIFLIFGIQRKLENLTKASTFDFNKYSLYCGDIMPIFFKLKWKGKPVTARFVETVLEPLVFLIIGYILRKNGQHLGTLLIVCSIVYSISYIHAYTNGDIFTLNIIDGGIGNNQKVETFADIVSGAKDTNEYDRERPGDDNWKRVPPPPPGSMGPPPRSARTMVE